MQSLNLIDLLIRLLQQNLQLWDGRNGIGAVGAKRSSNVSAGFRIGVVQSGDKDRDHYGWIAVNLV